MGNKGGKYWTVLVLNWQPKIIRVYLPAICFGLISIVHISSINASNRKGVSCIAVHGRIYLNILCYLGIAWRVMYFFMPIKLKVYTFLTVSWDGLR